MTKIKVLHFSIGNVMGGVTQYALNIWKHIDRNRFQLDFVTMSSKLDFAEDLLKDGSNVYYISCYAEKDQPQFEYEISNVLKKGYDVIHLHTNWWRSFLVEELAKKYGVAKIIVHSHNTHVGIEDERQRAYETQIHMIRRDEISPEIATDFWACSHVAAEWLYGKNIPKEKIIIRKNAIEIESFLYDENTRRRVRNELNIGENFVIGHVGRFAYQKNHDFLLDVFTEIYARNENVILMLIGTGALEEEIKRKAKERKIDDRILFMGKRTDINTLYQAMDLFVLPSRYEGLPISLIEAQTAGLKCLCSDEITKEADITGLLKFVKLERAQWIKECEESISCIYERMNMKERIINAGYDIQQEIKKIEDAYACH